MGTGEIMGYVEAIGAEHLDTCDLCFKLKPRVEGKAIRSSSEIILWICKECNNG